MYRIGHLEVESPFGNAGGVIKTPEDAELMAHSGVGWMEGGSWTLEERRGNAWNSITEQYDRTVYYYDPETAEACNSLGMPNRGIAGAERDVPAMVEVAHEHGKPFIMNVAPTSYDPITESQELVRRAIATSAAAVLLNAGCPNVITDRGTREPILSRNPEELELVLNGLRGVVENYDQQIFIRTSPADNEPQARDIMSVIRASGVISAVFTPNTWPGFQPKKDGKFVLDIPGNGGGRSGPATADISLEQTKWAVAGLEGSGIAVVSSSGIMTGQELHRRIEAGAVAGAGTTLFYQSVEEGWSEAVDRLLRQYVDISHDQA